MVCVQRSQLGRIAIPVYGFPAECDLPRLIRATSDSPDCQVAVKVPVAFVQRFQGHDYPYPIDGTRTTAALVSAKLTELHDGRPPRAVYLTGRAGARAL